MSRYKSREAVNAGRIGRQCLGVRALVYIKWNELMENGDGRS